MVIEVSNHLQLQKTISFRYKNIDTEDPGDRIEHRTNNCNIHTIKNTIYLTALITKDCITLKGIKCLRFLYIISSQVILSNAT